MSATARHCNYARISELSEHLISPRSFVPPKTCCERNSEIMTNHSKKKSSNICRRTKDVASNRTGQPSLLSLSKRQVYVLRQLSPTPPISASSCTRKQTERDSCCRPTMLLMPTNAATTTAARHATRQLKQKDPPPLFFFFHADPVG